MKYGDLYKYRINMARASVCLCHCVDGVWVFPNRYGLRWLEAKEHKYVRALPLEYCTSTFPAIPISIVWIAFSPFLFLLFLFLSLAPSLYNSFILIFYWIVFTLCLSTSYNDLNWNRFTDLRKQLSKHFYLIASFSTRHLFPYWNEWKY